MAAQAYTDLFNTAINNLATTLNAVTGLVCITDPRNVQAPCVLLEAMSFTAFNANLNPGHSHQSRTEQRRCIPQRAQCCSESLGSQSRCH